MSKTVPPIFTSEFLETYLQNFKLEQVSGIFEKKQIILGWQQQQASGKLAAMNEIEPKSRFIGDIFGKVLGFQFEDASQWLIREELKTTVDGTRPDAALGLFTIRDREIDNQVRVIVETKRSGADLDDPQTRSNNKNTAVEQAFLYATKFSSKCRWVAVTNFDTIRFYHASYQGECQVFELKNLLEETTLKTLLFLFQKEQLLNRRLAPTDKLYELRAKPVYVTVTKRHILDEIYQSLYRFDELPFVEPNFIAGLYPFNILDEQVWHYENTQLYTLNPAVYHLLKHIEVKDDTISISEVLRAEFRQQHVTEADHKIDYIFKKLSNCLIFQIVCFEDLEPTRKRYGGAIGFTLKVRFAFEKDEGLIREIRYHDSPECSCSACLYKAFDLKRLARQLKANEGQAKHYTMDEGFGNYLLARNDYKTSYLVYKSIAEKTKGGGSHAITYFLTQLNLKAMATLISDYQLGDGPQLETELNAIDTDLVLYQEVDLFIDEDQLRYLKRIKDRRLYYLVKEHLINLLGTIRQNREDHLSGRTTWNVFPDHTHKLHYYYYMIFAHHQGNLLVGDVLDDYGELTEKYAEAMAISYQLPTGFKSLNSFHISEMIWHLPTVKLERIWENVPEINMETIEQEKILSYFQNFLDSGYELAFNRPIEDRWIYQLFDNFSFAERYRRIFANLFILLIKLNISDGQLKPLTQPIIRHLQVGRHPHTAETGSLAEFIKKRGYIFTVAQLYELLEVFMSHQKAHHHFYEPLGKAVPEALQNFYPDFKINDTVLIRKTLANCTASNGYHSYNQLLPIYMVCNEACRQALKEGIEISLNANLNYHLYQECLRIGMFLPNENHFFQQLIAIIKQHKRFGFQGVPSAQTPFNNYFFSTFAVLLFQIDWRISDEDRKLFGTLTPYESWLLDPENFNYAVFNPQWLTDVDNIPAVLGRLKAIPDIGPKLVSYLNEHYDQGLSKIYFEHFARP